MWNPHVTYRLGSSVVERPARIGIVPGSNPGSVIYLFNRNDTAPGQ